MSFDLVFWREKDGRRTDPTKIYKQIIEPQGSGLEDLPTSQIREHLAAAFPGLDVEDARSWFWNSEEQPTDGAKQKWPIDAGIFGCEVSATSLVFNFGLSCRPAVIQSVEKILQSFGIPAYDPQRAVRKPLLLSSPQANGLTLQIEDCGDLDNPAETTVQSIIHDFRTAGGPSYMVLSGRGTDYVQVAGGDGKFTAEWRAYPGQDNFVHWVAGHQASGDKKEIAIQTSEAQITVMANECLSAEEATEIVCAYFAGREKPAKYNWRDISDRFR